MSTALTRINQAPFTDDELEIIRSTVASKTSPNQFKLFIQVCKYSGLNPFAKQIYAVVRGSDMTIQTGIDGYRILAERSGKYAGQIGPEWCGEDGEWKDVWLSDKPPVASRIGVLRRDFEKPIWGVARYKSYEQSASPLWRKMPEVMLAKCAESLALRKAFPAEMSGIYTTEEMAQADGPEVSPTMNVESTATPAPSANERATRKRLNDIFVQGKEKELFSDVQGMAEFITDALELEEPLIPEQLVSLTADELYRVELAVSADRGLNGAA